MSIIRYFFIQCLLLPALFVTAWDIAVLTNDEIDFFQKGQPMGTVTGRLKELLSASYDPIGGYLYVSDVNQQNATIFRTNLLRSNEDPAVVFFEPVVSISKQMRVPGITFDPVSDTLFWTTGNDHSIMKLAMNHSNAITFPQPGSVVHQFKYEVPLGIAVDSCRRTLYWTNSHHPNVTIERSNLDGSDRKLIIWEDLYQPYDIEVDMLDKKIYWCDSKGNGFSIERANLDGTERQKLIEGVHREPSAITIGNDNIYWTDSHQKTLLSLPKNASLGVEPIEVKKYKYDTCGLVSNILFLNVDTEECPALSPFTKQIADNSRKAAITNSVANPNRTNNVENWCLNNGTLAKNEPKYGRCECNRGFEGDRCELSICHNYCVGEALCVVDENHRPFCHCPEGWSGTRCERDRCRGVCLNGGKCTLAKPEQTVCKCLDGFHGAQCEYKSRVVDELCRPLCLEQRKQSYTKSRYQSSSFSIHEMQKVAPFLCRCTEILSSFTDGFHDEKNDEIPKPDPLKRSEFDSRLNVVLISSLVVLCAILGIFVVFLTVKMVALRKRPRIRKRIVVNKPITPFPCRLNQPPPEQCEITIENCCNMNICETPCFEPEFKSTRATFKKKKSEDKRTLISSMHSNSSLEDENY